MKLRKRTTQPTLPVAVAIALIWLFGSVAMPGSAHAIVSARINPGACGSNVGDGGVELGDLTYVAPLSGTPEATPAGPYSPVGLDSAFVTVMAVARIDLSLDHLLQESYSVNIQIVNDGTGENIPLACGNVGGVRNGDDLVFGLQTAPSEGTDTTGVVWLHASPGGITLVRVFIAQGLGAPPEDTGNQGTPAA